MSTHVLRGVGVISILLAIAFLQACAPAAKPRTPAEIRAQIVRLLPSRVVDRAGWANDMQSAFAALAVEPSTQNVCAALAVTEQESGFVADPIVPGLGRIALQEIDHRAERRHVPLFVVHSALRLSSHEGKSYADRISAVRTERELSETFEDFIGALPMGTRLLQGANPVHTGGPMQVSISFAEQYARVHAYPYPVAASLRHEVFSRRGGVYFGIAHLLAYPAAYTQPLYRFADYNAGFYASRNAAFQKAASLAAGVAIPLDGDLVGYGRKGNQVGATEAAVRSLERQLELTDAQVHRALELGSSAKFERSTLYERVFDLAEQQQHRPLPRAILPRITLESPKITRPLTTEWFAKRVNQRYQRCLAKAGP